MALVRCSCLVDLATTVERNDVVVRVIDPACGYVVHRLGAMLGESESFPGVA